jgi:uncharacterized membrane protein
VTVFVIFLAIAISILGRGVGVTIHLSGKRRTTLGYLASTLFTVIGLAGSMLIIVLYNNDARALLVSPEVAAVSLVLGAFLGQFIGAEAAEGINYIKDITPD